MIHFKWIYLKNHDGFKRNFIEANAAEIRWAPSLKLERLRKPQLRNDNLVALMLRTEWVFRWIRTFTGTFWPWRNNVLVAGRAGDFWINRSWAFGGFDAFFADGKFHFWKYGLRFGLAENQRVDILKILSYLRSNTRIAQRWLWRTLMNTTGQGNFTVERTCPRVSGGKRMNS